MPNIKEAFIALPKVAVKGSICQLFLHSYSENFKSSLSNVKEACTVLHYVALKGSVCHLLASSLGKGGLKLSLMN